MRKCTNRLLKKQKLKPQCFGPYAMRLLENYILDKDDFAGKATSFENNFVVADLYMQKLNFLRMQFDTSMDIFIIQTNKTEVYGPKNGIKTQNVLRG